MPPDGSGRSPAIAPTISAPADKPPIEFTNEIRYAVVMYGGVSLCMYIDRRRAGTTQAQVRATAPDASESAARIAKKA